MIPSTALARVGLTKEVDVKIERYHTLRKASRGRSKLAKSNKRKLRQLERELDNLLSPVFEEAGAEVLPNKGWAELPVDIKKIIHLKHAMLPWVRYTCCSASIQGKDSQPDMHELFSLLSEEERQEKIELFHEIQDTFCS